MSKETGRFYCNICNVSCGSEKCYKLHLTGNKHQNKSARVSEGLESYFSIQSSSFNINYCWICEKQFSSQSLFLSHQYLLQHKMYAIQAKLREMISSTSDCCTIGVNLVKVTLEGSEFVYNCTVCHSNWASHNIFTHIISQNHCIAFLKFYYPGYANNLRMNYTPEERSFQLNVFLNEIITNEPEQVFTFDLKPVGHNQVEPLMDLPFVKKETGYKPPAKRLCTTTASRETQTLCQSSSCVSAEVQTDSYLMRSAPFQPPDVPDSISVNPTLRKILERLSTASVNCESDAQLAQFVTLTMIRSLMYASSQPPSPAQDSAAHVLNVLREELLPLVPAPLTPSSSSHHSLPSPSSQDSLLPIPAPVVSPPSLPLPSSLPPSHNQFNPNRRPPPPKGWTSNMPGAGALHQYNNRRH